MEGTLVSEVQSVEPKKEKKKKKRVADVSGQGIGAVRSSVCSSGNCSSGE